METNNKEIERNEVVSINYSQPKFWHRVMANFVDFFLMLVFFVGLFAATRAIVVNTDNYKQVEQKISDIQLNCGLYVKDMHDEGKNVDIIYYIDNYVSLYGGEFEGVADDGGEPIGKIGLAVASINKFINYCSNPDNVNPERCNELIAYYDSTRLNTLSSDGIHYFVKDDDKIVPNETLTSNKENRQYFYKDVYTPIIEDRFLPFLTSNVTEYREAFRVEFNYLVFLEIPVAYAFAGILVYFVPPLFFRRGRKTLGKALYHIGLVDQRVLSPSFSRFLARFCIFYFAELILSLVTLGIPYIISFSIMAFSKDKQGFPDYMLHLYEIDTSKANIYMDYVEAELKNELHGEAVDFRMEKPL